jgi:hypothetical protein
MMRSRALRIAILVFEALWLNVVVPGHTRGSVALPGERCPSCERCAADPISPCCDMPEGQPVASHPHSVPHRDPARHCAICYFAARLSLPVVFDFTHPPLGLLGAAAPQPAGHIVSIPFVATYDGRAPPQASPPSA